MDDRGPTLCERETPGQRPSGARSSLRERKSRLGRTGAAVGAGLDDSDVGFGHLVPGSREISKGLGDDHPGFVRQGSELFALRVGGFQCVHARTEVEGARVAFARVPKRPHAHSVGCRHGHLDGVLDPFFLPSPRRGRPFARRRSTGSLSSPKVSARWNIDLRVGCALDRRKERVVDGEHELPLHTRELTDQSVVHPQPAPVAERVRVGLLDRRPRRRPDMREEEP